MKIQKFQKGTGKLINLLLDDIVKAAKNSPIDFSDWGKLHRPDMLKIPGNQSIVSRLSDSELGYLLYNRNGQILNGTGSRYAIFTGSGPMSVKRINIFDSPGRNTGYLIPEYRNVVPGTVSTHYVENLTDGLSKGISEDSYNALMNITGMPLSANRIWKMPEITSRVYAKFKPGVTNPNFKMTQEWLATDLGASTYKPKWWSSGSSWDDELKYLQQRSAIDAGISEGDELFNRFDDFHEDIIRFPIEKTRPVIQGPTRFIPTKHEFLFQINPQTIKNGTPVVNWLDPSIWLKKGGRIAKYQGAGWIGKGIKWLSTKGDDIIKSSKNLGINLGILGADGKMFHSMIPQNSENFYRIVEWDAILDAKKSKVIRGNPYTHDGPYFQYNNHFQAGRKRVPLNNSYIDGRFVIEGTPTSAENWIDSWRASSRKSYIENNYKALYGDPSERAFWKELYETPIKSIFEPIIENPVAIPHLENKGKMLMEFGTEAFPMTNGVFEAPAKNFFYYKKYPLFGWRRFKFKFGGSINKNSQ